MRTAARTGVPASTMHPILVRSGLNRLSWIDRPTGRVSFPLIVERLVTGIRGVGVFVFYRWDHSDG